MHEETLTDASSDFLAIFRRRKWCVIVPALLLLSLSTVAALIWPATYRSTATILIEEPDVPRDLVTSTIGNYADQRVQVFSQRILSRQNIIEMIEEFDLYREARQETPIGLLAAGMREKIHLELVSADVVDPRSGRPTVATIAFTLSFDHKTPEVAQRIASELTALFLAENLRTRREKATDTTEFFARESSKLAKQISGLETQLATFKEENAGSLPEQIAINARIMERIEQELFEARRRIQSLEERRIYLRSALSQIDPADKPNGEENLDPEEILKSLENEFVRLSGIYSPDHPDIAQLSGQIQSMRPLAGKDYRNPELEDMLKSVEIQLSEARKAYSETHPDVVKLERTHASIAKALSGYNGAVDQSSATTGSERSRSASNPIYIEISAQLEATESELKSYKDQKVSLLAKLSDLEEKILKAPSVEGTYRQLTRDYEIAVSRYEEMRAKQLEAELGGSLETERKAERFNLIEPPALPLSPISPNRRAIFFIGLVLSVGCGIGLGAAAEVIDQTVHGPKHLASITGAPPLMVLPQLSTRAQQRRKLLIVVLVCPALAALLVLSIYVFHIYVMPLEILYDKLSQKIGLKT